MSGTPDGFTRSLGPTSSKSPESLKTPTAPFQPRRPLAYSKMPLSYWKTIIVLMESRSASPCVVRTPASVVTASSISARSRLMLRSR